MKGFMKLQGIRTTRYRSFLFPEASIKEGVITLDSRESHHLVRVLRARKGTPVEVLDGNGTHYFGTIEILDARAVVISVNSIKRTAMAEPRIVLLQSESKGKAMDFILRMATEIGVAAIQPVFTDQGDHVSSKIEKRSITMIEACKQCGLGHLPELREPCRLQEWLKENSCADDSLRLVASLEEESQPLLEGLSRSSRKINEVIVAVGPVGDFSAAEYELLREANFKAVRLGANVLRVETAATYLLSVIDQALRTRLS